MKACWPLMAASLLIAGAVQAKESPVRAFLTAADAGDTAAMQKLLGKHPLPAKISGCYLAGYDLEQRELGGLASWMCPDGEKASRNVWGLLAANGRQVELQIVKDTRSETPLPPRTGPARDFIPIAPLPSAPLETKKSAPEAPQ